MKPLCREVSIRYYTNKKIYASGGAVGRNGHIEMEKGPLCIERVLTCVRHICVQCVQCVPAYVLYLYIYVSNVSNVSISIMNMRYI